MELGELKVTLRQALMLRSILYDETGRLKNDPPNSSRDKRLDAILNLNKRLDELFPDDYMSIKDY